MVCAFEGCEAPIKIRGHCTKHYDYLRHNGKLEVTPRKHRNPTVWDPNVKAADYRTRMEAAKAKVNQALLMLRYPGSIFPATLEEVLDEALQELEVDGG
jgi:hypothetical protein